MSDYKRLTKTEKINEYWFKLKNILFTKAEAEKKLEELRAEK